ncbi:hypothetical protein [Lysinibacillus sp. NPDC086135]|uniref:hypothetical protein n=1 Tax=Lysinibacillus sp. NPDC086135 TaxID=3364130 RepID=UPI003816EA51
MVVVYNGWFVNKFWRSINIKVDMEIKEGATDKEVNLLLSVLDYTKFIDLLNAVANLLMYRCGLRIGTISRMREQHVDFVNQSLQLDGEVMKKTLPIDDQMTYLLEVMVKQNDC